MEFEEELLDGVDENLRRDIANTEQLPIDVLPEQFVPFVTPLETGDEAEGLMSLIVNDDQAERNFNYFNNLIEREDLRYEFRPREIRREITLPTLPPPRTINEYQLPEEYEIIPTRQRVLEQLIENATLRMPERDITVPRPRPVRHPDHTDQLRIAEERLRRRRQQEIGFVEALPFVPEIRDQIAEEEVVPPRPEPIQIDPAIAEQHRLAYEQALAQIENPPQERPAQPDDEVETVMREWLEWRSERWGNTTRAELRKAEQDRDTYDTLARNIGQNILPNTRTHLREKRVALARAREAVTGIGNDETLIQAELQRLKEHPAVVGFQVESRGQNKGLFAVLRVFARSGYDGNTYDLGDWRLRLTVTADQPRSVLFQQLRSGRMDGRQHPKSGRNGFDFCNCGLTTTHLQTALDTGDYFKAVDQAISGIVHLDRDDGMQLLDKSHVITDRVPLAIEQIRWFNERRNTGW